MKRVWYTAWPFLAVAVAAGSILAFPAQSFLVLGCAGLLVALAAVIGLRWNSYKESK